MTPKQLFSGRRDGRRWPQQQEGKGNRSFVLVETKPLLGKALSGAR